MEKTASEAAAEALQLLTTPPAPSPISISAERWDWKWDLVGNETPDEQKKLEAMITATKEFVSEIVAGGEPRWLTFLGNPGCGKTHLSDRVRWFLQKYGESIYNRTVRASVDPLSENVATIFSYAQEGAVLSKWGTIISQARDGDFSMLRKASADHYKVIDDLGVDSMDAQGAVTPFAAQKMADLLDRRLGKWTIITSNYTHNDFAKKFDARIGSRLVRGNNVLVNCSGIRDFDTRRYLAKEAA